MIIDEYIEKNKSIENAVLEFLENESEAEDEYQNLKNIIDEHKICADKHELTLFLHLLSQISENHKRIPNFINKLEKILKNYENDIKQNFSNLEIFDIFKSSKRILLFLFEEKILLMDKYIASIFLTKKYTKAKYLQYFSPEIKPFVINNEIDVPPNFNELRKKGTNDNYICELIQNDSIEEFISLINKNVSPQSIIPPSIYETNSFLIKMENENDSYYIYDDEKMVTLIKYAVYYGSFQIIQYLQTNGVKLTPKLWLYAIAGQNAEMIDLLIENSIKFKDFSECLSTSIYCHHNNITNYLLDNYFENDFKQKCKFWSSIFKSYNFSLMKAEKLDEIAFFYMCKFNYIGLIKNLLASGYSDVSRILNKNVQSNFSIKYYNIIQNLICLI